jgi:hypothetical protein
LLSDAEKATLAEIAHRLGRNALEELAAVARPETLMACYRKRIAKKFDGSMYPSLQHTLWTSCRFSFVSQGCFVTECQFACSTALHQAPPIWQRPPPTAWEWEASGFRICALARQLLAQVSW